MATMKTPTASPRISGVRTPKTATPVRSKAVETASAGAAPKARDATRTASPFVDGFEAASPTKTNAAPGDLITSADQLVTLSDQASRQEIAIQATQVNGVSMKAGNAGDICGGASLASSLVLGSGTPEAAQANASAMRRLFGARGALDQLPPGVDKTAVTAALDHLEKGSLSRTDLWNLQQGLYSAARTYGDKFIRAPGVDVGQMTAIVAELKGRGASLGATKMVEVTIDVGTSHWVAETPAGLINTGPNVDPKKLSPRSPDWGGDVRLGADEVQMRARRVGGQAGEAGQGWSETLKPVDPNNVGQVLTRHSTDVQLAEAQARMQGRKAEALK